MKKFAPKQPLNTLDNALAIYKEWIRPLLTDDEFRVVEKIADNFARNEGYVLAQKLQDYTDSLPDNKNWMAPFWTKMYLSIRDSLLTESNYALHLTRLENASKTDNDLFIARWISSIGYVYQQIKNNPCAIYENNGHIFCDLNTHNLLGCARIPHKMEDKWINYDEFLTNIAVFYKEQCFIMPIFDNDHQLLSDTHIAQQLRNIKKEEGNALCHFISSSFKGSDTCAAFMQDFLSDRENKQSFDELNKTICHIVLTDEDFKDSLNNHMDIVFTLPHTRWCYKPLTLLMWKNNEISAHMEHTGADGIVMMRILQLAKEQFLKIKTHTCTTENSHHYHPLVWNHNAAQMDKLNTYRREYEHKVSEYCIKIYDFDATSSRFSNISRDALAHIILQYGMNKITAIPKSIYASCSMGHFREGRTEALRTVSAESQAFIKDLEKTHQFNPTLFEQALLAHKNRIKLCKQGRAPTRYLSGLAWMSDNPSSIEFFNNPLAQRLNDNYFSTSNIGILDDLCSLFLFSPPMPARYGFGYLINQDTIRFCISYHRCDQKDLDKMLAGFEEFYRYSK